MRRACLAFGVAVALASGCCTTDPPPQNAGASGAVPAPATPQAAADPGSAAAKPPPVIAAQTPVASSPNEPPKSQTPCARDADCVIDQTNNPYCACCFCPTVFARHKDEPAATVLWPQAPCEPNCPEDPCAPCPPDSDSGGWRAVCTASKCAAARASRR